MTKVHFLDPVTGEWEPAEKATATGSTLKTSSIMADPLADTYAVDEPGANTAASVTLPAPGAGYAFQVRGTMASVDNYSVGTASGRLRLKFGSTTVFALDMRVSAGASRDHQSGMDVVAPENSAVTLEFDVACGLATKQIVALCARKLKV